MDDSTNYSFWNKCWEDEHIPWHRKNIDPNMEKYMDKLVNGKTNAQVFFPLCGKSVDMMVVYKAGHRVIGVEFCEKAIEDFFTDQGLDYKVEKVESLDGMLYQTKDERLKIFRCDFFKFNRDCAGLMDAVWDRGSFVAIEKDLRIKYVETIIPLLAPTFRYILIGIKYKDWFFSGAPHSVSEELIYYLFDKNCDITCLHKRTRNDEMLKSIVKQDAVEEFTWLLKEKQLT